MAFDLLFLAFCIAIIAADVLFRRVFNWLVILGIAAKAVGLAIAADTSPVFAQQWPAALAGMGLAFVFMLAFYVFRAMGAGDVKFFAVLGFWLGTAPLLPIWLAGSLLAGIHGLIGFFYKNGVMGQWVALQLIPAQGVVSHLPVLQRAGNWIGAVRGGRRGIPYAAYLAIAALVFVQWN